MIFECSLTEKDNLHRELAEKVADLKRKFSLDERDIFEINLILDEVCTNIFENNTKKNNLKITINISHKENKCHIFIEDNGAPFDPSRAPSPNTNLPLEKRDPGGLGIFLVKKYTTFLSYERAGNFNRVTVDKELK